MEKTISQISRMMAPVLNDAQLSELNDVLYACLCGKGRHLERGKNAKEHLHDFLAAKKGSVPNVGVTIESRWWPKAA